MNQLNYQAPEISQATVELVRYGMDLRINSNYFHI